jgi:hypothetical protein
MPKSCLFPYGIALHEAGSIGVFPAANVLVQSTAGEWILLFLLIDSGATVSALPKSDAVRLGIEAQKGRPMTVRGVGRKPLRGWRHELTVRLGQNELRVPLAFLDDPQAPRVLGRAGAFDRFTVVFEENRHRTGLLGEHTPEAETREISEAFVHSVLFQFGGGPPDNGKEALREQAIGLVVGGQNDRFGAEPFDCKEPHAAGDPAGFGLVAH